MNGQELLGRTADFVKEIMTREGSGHDWWHVYRVWQLVKRIAPEEHADVFITELAALLHDLRDPKLMHSIGTTTDELVIQLKQIGYDEPTIERVFASIQGTSFSSSIGKSDAEMQLTAEAKIISDADKLEAIGAIGIARAFTYGGSKGRLIHDPNYSPQTHASGEAYHAADTPAIAHFHEKLLLLKDRMHTKTGKKIAEERHKYMEQFLEEFYAEWDGKR